MYSIFKVCWNSVFKMSWWSCAFWRQRYSSAFRDIWMAIYFRKQQRKETKIKNKNKKNIYAKKFHKKGWTENHVIIAMLLTELDSKASLSSWDTRIHLCQIALYHTSIFHSFCFDSIVVGKQMNSTTLVKILRNGHRIDCEFKCDIHHG